MERFNIVVVPAGRWGSALAIPLSDNGHNVKLYQSSVFTTSSLKEAVLGADILILACNSAHVRSLFQKITSNLPKDTIVLCVSKGIEEDTNFCMSQVLTDIEPKIGSRLAVLSGPNFAAEVAQRLPTMTIVASENTSVAKLLQRVFTTKNFRVYIQDDVLGVELGGALKNVIALGVGIGDGLKLGENGRAALITRGITEIMRLGTAMGAQRQTFTGLSGMGDLILTCTSKKSRNHQAGLKIGRGLNPKDLLSSNETIEGLHTVKAAVKLAKEKGIKVPIMETVYKIVYQGLKPKGGFKQLMELELSSENED